jgi:hypothetical protein
LNDFQVKRGVQALSRNRMVHPKHEKSKRKKNCRRAAGLIEIQPGMHYNFSDPWSWAMQTTEVNP